MESTGGRMLAVVAVVSAVLAVSLVLAARTFSAQTDAGASAARDTTSVWEPGGRQEPEVTKPADQTPPVEEPDTPTETTFDEALSVFQLDEDEAWATLARDMEEGRVPKSCTVLYDQMGARPQVTLTDEADIRAVYELVSGLKVVGTTLMSMTDAYHRVSFELADGRYATFSFEGDGMLVCDPYEPSYVVANAEPLWRHIRSLQDEEMGPSTVEVPSPSPQEAYAITLGEGADYVLDCPESAEEGDVILLRTVKVPDAVELSIQATGTSVVGISADRFWFRMPAHDVTLDVTSSIAGL